MSEPDEAPAADAAPGQRLLELVRTHLRFGWIALLVFATFGGVLEALHAFKSAAYLGVGNEMRRLMWTLTHAHGIGLSILHLAFAATLKLGFVAETSGTAPALRGGATSLPRLQRASSLLRWSTLFLPGGFFLGGIAPYEGDPGVGVWLAPIGALLLWSAIVLVAFALAADER